MFSRHNKSVYILLTLLSLGYHYTSAYRLSTYEYLNPNLRCPGKNEEQKWFPCKYGGYIENLDPKNCADRYICFVGLNEPCQHGDKCANNAICTVCGVCQKCDSPDNCSDFELCPNSYDFSGFNFIKRRMQKRGLEHKVE